MRLVIILALASFTLEGCPSSSSNNASNAAADAAYAPADSNGMGADHADMMDNAADAGAAAANVAGAFPDDAASNAAPPADAGSAAGAAVEPEASADPSAPVYCQVIQDRIPPADCDYYREIWARLEPGRGAMDVVGPMIKDRPATVSFALARPASPNRPGAVSDPAVLLDSPPERTGTVRVGRRMAVALEGEGFTIQPAGLVEKDLSAGGAARWNWRVTPLRGGRLRLTLSAYVVVQPPHGPRGENLIRTLSQDVDVAVTGRDRAAGVVEESRGWLERGAAWLGALAAFVAALFGLRVAVRRFRKKTRSQDQTEPGNASDDSGPDS